MVLAVSPRYDGVFPCMIDLKQNFYGQFAEATQEGLVRNMRTVFGLSADGVGSLAVLADEASE
jgi:hypothetical protein